MCGIFGIITNSGQLKAADIIVLARHARQRGSDSSGLLHSLPQGGYAIDRAEWAVDHLLRQVSVKRARLVVGHSRLITNGLEDNQPVERGGVVVFHNGIIVNDTEVWERSGLERHLTIDSEVIAALFERGIDVGDSLEDIVLRVLEWCHGVIAAVVALPRQGKLLLFSNNGSLYLGMKGEAWYFASEAFALNQLGCVEVQQVRALRVLNIPASDAEIHIQDHRAERLNLVPVLHKTSSEERLLKHEPYRGRRCSRCILPETMPFIAFDTDGVCNYCRHYVRRNQSRPVSEIEKLVEGYRRVNGPECIVPFSGGRDSCLALHLVVKELGLRAIAYTYDWGMVTDLGRRNISRMCAALGVENIIVADNIARKRKHIARNLTAWLRAPDLGMMSILTAGDKHFFRHVETVKRQTGVQLNLWGVNPLEVTHFKAGFLGVPPDFAEKLVYSHGLRKQLRYHGLRTRAMLRSPGYFNTSLWDTLYGEFYRSFTNKQDYYHLFDYWQWDENMVDATLSNYDWERAIDTQTTWRIGDGTAAFYNYVYQSVVGFTEHDTFRSNQVREGQLSRDAALTLVEDENRPRYPNIKWYLDALGMDFAAVIGRINRIPFGAVQWRAP
jgi:glucosamine--fructose-6-phosphate aminotransferase (isomerizing)